MSEFLTISRLVTGVDDLDAALAETYRALMRGTAAAARELAALQSLAAVAVTAEEPEVALKAALAGDCAAAAAARRLAYLWYAGRLPPEGKDEAPFPTEAAYFGGLLWRVVGAHPPGLSGGYTGHWRYAPDA
ncbi:hypothetical protein MCBMB27_05680 (plasmid) [Methylobacterium phyllosphaerae]|uniref:SNase domain containing protein n=2 Tax=Methylobacterium TaxID=407 RepID=A0A088B2B7_9HYPH|nr:MULTISPECIES: sugar dehydrogenase complex small subunit [Methylobacterium]AGO88278.1 SNase domain containing protein [Methylobacterium oryzae CBMB20]APT34971.1 hypothetical protein MCBMB27_05680 [Methylobacterium phyllosphaerae]SFH65833.1 Membrane bound FAD containing D-sorbitol dehydrogenase [Methylobacterium phyllosphaerae]